jgi:tRNA 5-methylaminomethyl-2-thiouridine biosynthesis bifunctional protein
MNAGQPPWLGAAPADIEWGEANTPCSHQFQDFYYSSVDGLAECRHVFLDRNALPERWRLPQASVFTILETGFGTGLNFLATWESWRANAPQGNKLHYLAIEKFPVRAADLARAHGNWPELNALSGALQEQYPPPLPGRHRLLLDEGRVILDLVFADVHEGLTALSQSPGTMVDAWYLDGFTPSRNPDMWSPQLYTAMAQLSRPQASFATFTAAGDVRRGLQDVGFEVNKAQGFGIKREMLYGNYKAQAEAAKPTQTPWHLSPAPPAEAKTALVLGGGLAGTTIASALAKRGWKVTLLERDRVAGAASGNAQGVLYTRISHRQSDLNDFSLHSFCFAHRFYRQLMQSGQLREGEDGEFCGALHLTPDWNEDHPLYETVNSLPELAKYLDRDTAQSVSGLPQCPPGLFYPLAGWMNPPAVCAALLKQSGITVKEQCGDVQLHRQSENWQVLDSSGAELASGDIAIIACGSASGELPGLQWLPLQKIRGQVSHITTSGHLKSLQTVLCHEGYLPPARHGEHCMGASFDIADEELDLREADQLENIAKLRKALPDLEFDVPVSQMPQGRVGFRTASPDYLPMVGAVPDFARFCDDYAALRKNGRQLLHHAGTYLPGLYLSTAHGSRGLTSTPLCAEMLASQICGETGPLDAQLVRALSPGRFIIRDLIRNRL